MRKPFLVLLTLIIFAAAYYFYSCFPDDYDDDLSDEVGNRPEDDGSDYDYLGIWGYESPFLNPKTLDVENNHAFIIDSYEKLIIVDISDPANPEVAALYNGLDSPEDIVVYGDYAYIVDMELGLVTLDVSNPASPVELDILEIDNLFYFTPELEIFGNRLYVDVWKNSGHFYIFEINSTGDLELVGGSDTLLGFVSHNWSVVSSISKTISYSYNYDLSIYSYLDPANPTLVKEKTITFTTDVGIHDHIVFGDKAYLYAYDDGEYFLVTSGIYKSAYPMAINRLDAPVNELILHDQKIFVMYSDTGMDVYDISNDIPYKAASYEGSFDDIVFEGDILYALSKEDGFRIIDISTISVEKTLGQIEATGYAYGVDVEGQYAYVASGSDGMTILDISYPRNIQEISNVDTQKAVSIDVSGDYAFIAQDIYGMAVVQVSDPYHPQLISSMNLSIYPRDIKVVGNYAYVAGEGWDWGDLAFEIVDISDPYNPVHVSKLLITEFPDPANTIWVQGNYAYVADELADLIVADISDPYNPSVVSTQDTMGNAHGVAVQGNYAYIADERNGLVVIDIVVPSNPKVVGQVDTSNVAIGVAVELSRAYVADCWAGIAIVDISNPFNPVLIDQKNTIGCANDIVITDDYLVVADMYGLTIFDKPAGGGADMELANYSLELAWNSNIAEQFALVPLTY